VAKPNPRADLAQLPLFGDVCGDAHHAIVSSTDAAPLSADAAAAGAPELLRHPRATREIALGGVTVAYAVRRARRRSIGFVVGSEGLCVSAPTWVGWRDIEQALREKATWILAKLNEQHDRARRLQAARVEWRDGVTIPFLGQPVRVVLDPHAGLTATGASLKVGVGGGAMSTQMPTPMLHIGLPAQATPSQIREVVQSWLQRQARRVFLERSEHFAQLLGVQVRRVSLSSAQTRWGSASADGSVRLNWRLIHFGLATIDYVVAHELAHLREMNHSPRFWEVVRSVVPDYERSRRSLRSDTLPVFD
jgi:predicted metal-dependent hydrolase